MIQVSDPFLLHVLPVSCPKDFSRITFVTVENSARMMNDEKQCLEESFSKLPYLAQTVVISDLENEGSSSELFRSFIKRSQVVRVTTPDVSFERLHNFYISVEKESWKYDTAMDFISEPLWYCCQTVTFVNSAATGKKLEEHFRQRDIECKAVVSNVEKDSFKEFHNGTIRHFIVTGKTKKNFAVF